MGRVLIAIVAVVAGLIAVGLLVAGGFALWADQSQRNSDGFLTTPTERFTTATYAITKEGLDVDARGPGWVTDPDRLGRIRLTGEGRGAKPIFIGIGPEAAVADYLQGVARAEVASLDFRPFDVEYDRTAGGPPPRAPGSEDFWVAMTAGTGERNLTWDVRSGDWSVVVMNADGSRGVDVDLAVGAKLGFLLWVAVGLLIAGAVVAVAAGFLFYLAFRRRRPAPAPA